MTARGDGTTYKRGDGRYCAALVFERGERPVVRYATTEAEAIRLLREMRNQRDAGQRTASRSPKLSDYLSTWLADVKAPHVTPHTLDGYEDRAGLIIGKMGNVRIADLTPGRRQHGWRRNCVMCSRLPGRHHESNEKSAPSPSGPEARREEMSGETI